MNESIPFSDAKIDDCIFQAKLITAIKRHRELTNSSLMDAKVYVESRQETLWLNSPERFLKTPKILPRSSSAAEEPRGEDEE